MSYSSSDSNYLLNFHKPSNLLWTWIISRSWAPKFSIRASLDWKPKTVESHLGSLEVIGGILHWSNWLTLLVLSSAYSRAISNSLLLWNVVRSPFVSIGSDISSWEPKLLSRFAYNISFNFLFILHVNMVETIKWFLEIFKTIKTPKKSVEKSFFQKLKFEHRIRNIKCKIWLPNVKGTWSILGGCLIFYEKN